MWMLPMTKLIIFRGLPASGKSTEAIKRVKKDIENVIRVNRDSLRLMLHDGEFQGSLTENVVIHYRDLMIRDGLKRGKTIISDDINLDTKVVRHLANLANHYGAEVEVVDFDIDLYECIRRDALRESKVKVGYDVIVDLHKRFFAKGFPKNPLDNLPTPVIMKPHEYNFFLHDAVVFDIDGTLAKMNGRSPYDYTKVSSDLPNQDIIDLLIEKLIVGDKIIIVSGRPDSCKEDTIQWLLDHGIDINKHDISLFMRKSDDDRADFIIKYEIFDEFIRPNWNVKGWYDDRNQVVEAMRSIGIRVYQVAPGDF